jgi:hypothetical protein
MFRLLRAHRIKVGETPDQQRRVPFSSVSNLANSQEEDTAEMPRLVSIAKRSPEECPRLILPQQWAHRTPSVSASNIPDAGRAGGYFAYDAAAVPFSSVANDLL